MPGKSIRIYLADGTPLGIRHAELVNWTGQAIVAPRHRLSELKDWAEVRRPGVYFLFGKSETFKELAYIGESENVFDRLKSHVSQKDFWQHVAVFTSKDDNLTKSHVKYLESRLVELAIIAKRWDLENENTPQRPLLPRADRDAMDEFIGPLRILLGALSFNILEPVTVSARPSAVSAVGSRSAEDEAVVLTLQVAKYGVKADGASTDEGFVVFSGSIGTTHESTSLSKWSKRHRSELVSEGKLKLDGDQLVVVDDILFNSSSGAAAVLGGASYNGRILWKLADGRTLADLESETLK
jgi:hypothetical protein